MAAADFAEHGDVERARELLAELKVPNPAQYVSLVAERMMRTNRGPIDQDIENVIHLADALGVSTVSMIAYVSTPTPIPTETPIPTDTPPPTPTPTNTIVVQVDEAAQRRRWLLLPKNLPQPKRLSRKQLSLRRLPLPLPIRPPLPPRLPRSLISSLPSSVC